MSTYVAVAAVVVGTLIAAYGVYSQAQYQSASANYQGLLARSQADYQRAYGEAAVAVANRSAEGQRALAESEARMYENNAAAAKQAGEMKLKDLYRAGESLQAKSRVAIAKSGVDTTGSPVDVLLSNASEIEDQAERLRYATTLDVLGSLSGAGFARSEGSLRAQGIETEGRFRRFGSDSAVASLLGEAGFSRASGRRYGQAAMFGAGSTIVTGVGTLAYRYPSLFGG